MDPSRRTSGSRWRNTLLSMGCCLGLMGGRSGALGAQEIQIRPVADFSLPTRLSIKNGALDVRQRIGLTLGARMIMLFGDRFQVVTGVGYAPAYAVLRGTGKGFALTTGSHSLSASTGARYSLLPAHANPSWEMHTGLSLLFGGSPAYEDLFESSILTGVLGTSVAYTVGRIVRFQLSIQERLCRIRFGTPDGGRSSNPLRVSFKVSLPFLKAWRQSVRAVPSP